VPSKPTGLYCPECRGFRLTVADTTRPAPGVVVRYRTCTACGCQVKTTERVTKVLKAGTRRPAA